MTFLICFNHLGIEEDGSDVVEKCIPRYDVYFFVKSLSLGEDPCHNLKTTTNRKKTANHMSAIFE